MAPLKQTLFLAGVVFCVTTGGPVHAQNRPTRLVVDTRAVCHETAEGGSKAGNAIGPAANIISTRRVDSEGVTWYFADQFSTRDRPCWVYGPYTVESRPHSVSSGPYTDADFARDFQADWVDVLDHILMRGDAGFEEYVNIDNILTAVTKEDPELNAGLFQLRWLQMLSKAAGAADESFGRSPLKIAWLISHAEKDPFGVGWYIAPKRYWDLFDANKDAPWAEEAAWAAEQIDLPRDECFSDCMLDLLVNRPLQYWKRIPAGLHARDALALARTIAQSVAEMACSDGKPAADSQSPVSREVVADVRASLANVAYPEKGDILKSLDEAERKCAK